MFHARAVESIPVQEKHARFFAGLENLGNPWGISKDSIPSVPTFNGNSVAVCPLSKLFGDGIRKADILYRYRRLLADDGLSDDILNIIFQPAKVDLHYLCYSVIPTYVDAFGAYLVEYFDDHLIDLAWDAPKASTPSNPRMNVRYTGPVSFWDELLCRRAFNLSPADIASRLNGRIEHAEALHNGVYLIGSSQELGFQEAQRLCEDMKRMLVT